jgi:hypothetical protein
MACSCDGMGKCLRASPGPEPSLQPASHLKWAKVARLGGHCRGSFHAWRADGRSVCANGRRGVQAKAKRDRQPVNACRECLRILGGDPRLIQRYPLPGAVHG